MELRDATDADVPALGRLRWRLYDEDEPVLGETEPEYLARFAAFAGPALDSGDWTVLVALDGETIAGAMWVYRVPRVPQPGRGPAAPLAYLTNVYVDPPYRDRGLGSRMLDEVTSRCAAEGFSLVLTWPSERSFAFYERGGFTHPPDPLVLDLGGDEYRRRRP